MNSLAARLVVAASLVLAGFVFATGFALEKAFESSAKQAVMDRLKGMVFALLGATDVSTNGRLIVDAGLMPDERLSQPASGLRAYVLNEKASVLWRSVSASQSVRLVRLPRVGEWLFAENRDRDEPFVLAFGVHWSGDDSENYRYTVVVAEDSQSYQDQLDQFRGTLLAWLVGAAFILIIAQVGVLKWGLAPVRRLTGELRAIESGTNKDSIETDCPSELKPLVEGLNALLRHERGRQTRIRNALDDLAHSTKTPLAVLRGIVEHGSLVSPDREQIAEQVERIDQIVRYQLQSAATQGRQEFLRVQPLLPTARKLLAALAKVYRHKRVAFQIDIPEVLRIRADPQDLLELLGNLVDNACKWCKQTVKVSAKTADESVIICVEDDGPGFPARQPEELLRRGARADVRVEGQGIGLAVVAQIVAAYGGSVRLERSLMGGGMVSISFPAT